MASTNNAKRLSALRVTDLKMELKRKSLPIYGSKDVLLQRLSNATSLPTYEDKSLFCPICNRSTNIGKTINCVKCNMWLHFTCAKVTSNDECVKKKHVPFYCSECLQKNPTLGISNEKTHRNDNRGNSNNRNRATPKNSPNSKIYLQQNLSQQNITINQSMTIQPNLLGGRALEIELKNQKLEAKVKKVKEYYEKLINELNKQAAEKNWDLNEENKHLRDQNKAVRDENRKIILEVKKRNDENERLKADLRKQTESRSRELKMANDKYSNALKNEIRINKLLKQENEDTIQRIKSLEIQCENANLMSTSQELQNEDAKRRIKVLELQNEEETQRRKSLQLQYELVHSSLLKAKEKVKSLKCENKIGNDNMRSAIEQHKLIEVKLEKKHKHDIEKQVRCYRKLEIEQSALKLYCSERNEKLEELRKINDQQNNRI